MLRLLVAKRSHPEIKAMAQRLEVKHDRATENAILAHRMARAIYYMLSHGLAFSMCIFRLNPDTDSGNGRTPIPGMAGQ